MTSDEVWQLRRENSELRTLCYRLATGCHDERPGEDQLLFVLNADWRLSNVLLPEPGHGRRWRRLVDTSLDSPEDFLEDGKGILLDPQDHYIANPRSTVVLLAR